MELILGFLIFLLCMALSLFFGLSMLIPLAIGFVIFFLLALRQGFSVRQVLNMARGSIPDSLIVIRILLLIGALTGLWRACGTISYFVTFGVSLMPPSIFILASFLLSAIMSYAIGTSFGVSATCGVILMAIAKAGGVDPIITAGALFSGVYVGDRGSPAASSGNLVAVLTGTDMRDNVHAMIKSSILPFLICCVLYGVLSVFHPMQQVDLSLLENLQNAFTLNWMCLIPAILMLVLPFCRVKIAWSMLLSIAASFALTVFQQKLTFVQTLEIALLGYHPESASLQSLLSGGGMISMLEVCCVLTISGTYGGIFRGTGMLSGIQAPLETLRRKIGRYPTMLLLSVALCAVFCNQTIGAIMQSQLSDSLYEESKEEKREQMLDLENSVILTAAWIPWCLACSFILSTLGADNRAIVYGFYVYLLPLFYCIESVIKDKKEKKNKASV